MDYAEHMCAISFNSYRNIQSLNFVHLMLFVMFCGDMIDVDWYIIRGIACMLSILQYHYIG
jgi:hypothetical protein